MGAGKWAIEVADEYVHAIVHGIDLAPIQPTYIPLNCSFYVADVMVDMGPEMYPDGSIDLVHMRYHCLWHVNYIPIVRNVQN
jgi:hypothetical protein